MAKKYKIPRKKSANPKWFSGALSFGNRPIEVLELEDGWHARFVIDVTIPTEPPVRVETTQAYQTQIGAEKSLAAQLTAFAKLVTS